MNTPTNILVVGGSGGLGQAMTKSLMQRFPKAWITATYHSTIPLFDSNQLEWKMVDVTQENDIARLAVEFDHLDWLINCAGLLHDESNGPEKSVSHLSPEFFDKNIHVNTLPSLLLAKHFHQPFKRSGGPLFASISARVGSIEDNRLGGWYSYRASKAALNMVLKLLSIEWQRTIKNGCVAALHPGTNDTYLSRPFQSHVPKGKLFQPQQTAESFVDLLCRLRPEDSGQFWAWDGSQIAW